LTTVVLPVASTQTSQVGADEASNSGVNGLQLAGGVGVQLVKTIVLPSYEQARQCGSVEVLTVQVMWVPLQELLIVAPLASRQVSQTWAFEVVMSAVKVAQALGLGSSWQAPAESQYCRLPSKAALSLTVVKLELLEPPQPRPVATAIRVRPTKFLICFFSLVVDATTHVCTRHATARLRSVVLTPSPTT